MILIARLFMLMSLTSLLQADPPRNEAPAPASRPSEKARREIELAGGDELVSNDLPSSDSAGGARGPNDPLPLICVLAPPSVGRTLRPQPVIFWYLSADTDYPIHLTLNRNREPAPKIEHVLTGR